jgi:tRNA modification GTPase
MRRARGELTRADLALVVLDARDPDGGRAAVAEAIADVPLRLWIHNKADLLAAPLAADQDEVLRVSARTGQGIEALHARLRQLAQGNADAAGEGAFTARARHVDALAIAREHLAQARVELEREALDLAAESLRLAHDALGEITGRVHADDLLGHIFSSFCIGK